MATKKNNDKIIFRAGEDEVTEAVRDGEVVGHIYASVGPFNENPYAQKWMKEQELKKQKNAAKNKNEDKIAEADTKTEEKPKRQRRKKKSNEMKTSDDKKEEQGKITFRPNPTMPGVWDAVRDGKIVGCVVDDMGYQIKKRLEEKNDK